MILYVMEHMGYFSQMLTLRLRAHREEGAIFAVYRLETKPEMFKNMQKCDFFESVFTFRHSGFMAENKSLILGEFQTKHGDFIKKIEDNKVRLAYVGYDSFPSFSVLCELLELDIVTLEPFSNSINRLVPSFYATTYERGNCTAAFYDLQKKLVPLDENCVPVKKIIVFPETKIKDNEFVWRYDFNSEFDKVDNKDKDKVVRMFGLDNKSFKVEKQSFLLLNNPLHLKNNSTIKSYAHLYDYMYTDEKYSLAYAVACDYFYDDGCPLVLCPHPYTGRKADIIAQKLTSLASVEGMPIEYLRYVKDLKIHQLISFKTSATDKISDLAEHSIVLGLEFLSVFFYLDKLYAAGKILTELGAYIHLEYYGIPKGICENLFCDYKHSINFNKGIPRFESSKAYIINISLVAYEPLLSPNDLTQALASAPNDCIVFFVNSPFEYCFVNLDCANLLEHIIPIVIKRNAISDSPLDEPGESVIYAFTKDAKIRETLKNLQFSKDLLYSGIRLVVEPISEDRISAQWRRCFEYAVNRAALNKIFASSGQNANNIILQQPHSQLDELNRKIYEMTNTIREREAALNEARHHLHSYESFVAWKLLKPLRFVYRIIKNLRNK